MKRYTNNVVSSKTVKSGERDIYDYKVNIREIGRENKLYSLSITFKQKKPPYYLVREVGVANNLEFRTKNQASKLQDRIIRDLKAGVNVEVVINSRYQV